MKGIKTTLALAALASLWACTSDGPPSRSVTNAFPNGAASEKGANGQVMAGNSAEMSGDTGPKPMQPAPDQSQNPSAGNSGNDLPSDPNTAVANGNFPQVTFNLVSPPTGQSDIYSYTLKVEADAAISHYAYKIDSPENCGKGSGYKVESSKTPLPVSIASRADGPVAVCLLGYYFPGKQWLAPAEAKVFAWEKAPFNRKFSAYYEEFDEFCGKLMKIDTEIEIKGDVAIYSWTRDAQAQGCDDELYQGKETMTIVSNDSKEMRGFWSFNGASNGGWFRFTWSDAGRTAFTGKYGYGEPDLQPEGNWNTK